MEKLLDEVMVEVKKTENEIKSVSLLSLAFLGDNIHSLFVREKLVESASFKVKDLHSMTTKFVKASSQSFVLDKIKAILTEEELRIVNSARNSKTNNIAKNSTIKDYKNATAFESLLGYLGLKNDFERLRLILNRSYDIILEMSEK